MLKINETVAGYDLAELLHGESGIFEATSPVGEKFQCVCRAGASISNLRPITAHTAPDSQQKAWRARKIGELRLEQQTVG